MSGRREVDRFELRYGGVLRRAIRCCFNCYCRTTSADTLSLLDVKLCAIAIKEAIYPGTPSGNWLAGRDPKEACGSGRQRRAFESQAGRGWRRA